MHEVGQFLFNTHVSLVANKNYLFNFERTEERMSISYLNILEINQPLFFLLVLYLNYYDYSMATHNMDLYVSC